MTDLCFVDTNLFVYSRDSADSGKQRRALEIIEKVWSSDTGRTSFQVLNELYTVLVYKLDADESKVREDCLRLLSWEPLPLDKAVFEQALIIRDHYKLSWWDCLIVSAALLQECGYLISEDLSDGARYLDLEVVNPFSKRSDKLLG